MWTHKIFPRLLGGLLVAGFVFGLSELWRLRFTTGTLYPAYSSLRADPLGVKVFYDSLARLPGVYVQRHYRPLTALPAERGTTLFLLGLTELSLSSMPPTAVTNLEAFVQRGGRLILALAPGRQRGRPHEPAVETAEDTTQPEDSTPEKPASSLPQRWGVQVDSVKPAAGKGRGTATQLQPFSAALPRVLPWHSELVFTSLDQAWRLLYERQNQAVLMERALGEGSVVLAADSYLFSNEALWRERQSALLAWMVGPHRTVIFDETHLGIQEQAGVMTLIRTYRLHGVVLALLGLAGLFVWRNATSLVPPIVTASASDTATVTGQDSASGLVSLLQRYVAPQEVLRLCLEEWQKAVPPNRPGIQTQLAQMRQVVTQYAAQARRAQRLVEGYQALSRIVQTKRGAG